LIWTRLKTYCLSDILDVEIHETESANKRTTYRRVYITLRGQQDIATALPADDEDLILSPRLFLSKAPVP
jgi:hypothetical protein